MSLNRINVAGKSTSVVFLLVHIMYHKWSNDSTDKLDSAQLSYVIFLLVGRQSSSEASSVVQIFSGSALIDDNLDPTLLIKSQPVKT